MDYHARNRKIFGISLLVLEVMIIIFYGFFVRTEVHSETSNNTSYYPMYQDVNVMILIGFGFLMTYIKHYVWSTLAYTYFINSIVVQLYLLLQPFWHKVFQGHWGDKLFVLEKTFTTASYSVASVLIAFGAVLGRTGPLELLIMAVVQLIFYTLNEHIVYVQIGAFDVGGSTAIHAFGAYFGVTVSFILSKYARPTHHPESNYSSNIFAYIGTLFLWMFWPSFNAGYFSSSPFEKSVIISNTIISLTGSCLGTFIMTSLVRQKFEVEDVLNASLAGGVIIGAAASLFINPAAALTVGLFGGILSSLGFEYIGHFLQQKFGIFDSCGVHNLHGMPGIFGGIFGAIAIASYASDPIDDPVKASYLPFYPAAGSNLNVYGRTFYGQGGIQMASIGISVGIAIGAGIIAGFLMRLVYRFKPQEFHNDEIYFSHATDDSEQKIHNDNPQSNVAIKN